MLCIDSSLHKFRPQGLYMWFPRSCDPKFKGGCNGKKFKRFHKNEKSLHVPMNIPGSIMFK